jgi:hypothetical protein
VFDDREDGWNKGKPFSCLASLMIEGGWNGRKTIFVRLQPREDGEGAELEPGE